MGLIQCPRCSGDVDSAAQFCKRCGTSMAEAAPAVATGVMPALAASKGTGVLPLESSTTAGGSHFRWYILALVFFATTINYVDRQVWNIIGPFLADKYHISAPQWGILGSAFA